MGASKDLPLMERLAQAYRETAILTAALRLDLFDRVAERPRAAAELAAVMHADPRGLRILCEACVALGLLEKRGEHFYNTSASAAHLLRHSPQPRRDIFLHHAKLYARWGHLTEAVLHGKPVSEDGLEPALQRDERTFALAMADVGRIDAEATVAALDLSGARTLLDAGGGPGIFASAFAQRWPKLRVTLFDRPGTLAVAREFVQQAGVGERVSYLPGDLFMDSFGGPYDFIFCSNVIHMLGEEDNAALVRKMAACLAPGGRLCLKDFFLDPARQAPASALLFAVNMLVNTEEGDCYTTEEALEWFTEAGLQVESPVPLPPQSQLLLARRSG